MDAMIVLACVGGILFLLAGGVPELRREIRFHRHRLARPRNLADHGIHPVRVVDVEDMPRCECGAMMMFEHCADVRPHECHIDTCLDVFRCPACTTRTVIVWNHSQGADQ